MLRYWEAVFGSGVSPPQLPGSKAVPRKGKKKVTGRRRELSLLAKQLPEAQSTFLNPSLMKADDAEILLKCKVWSGLGNGRMVATWDPYACCLEFHGRTVIQLK